MDRAQILKIVGLHDAQQGFPPPCTHSLSPHACTPLHARLIARHQGQINEYKTHIPSGSEFCSCNSSILG